MKKWVRVTAGVVAGLVGVTVVGRVVRDASRDPKVKAAVTERAAKMERRKAAAKTSRSRPER